MTTWPATRRPGVSAPAILRAGLALAVAGVAIRFQPLSATQVSGRVLLDGRAGGLRASMPLRVGDALQTADGNAAALSLTPGIGAWLTGHSALKVEDLRVGEHGENVEERFARVRLERGAAMFSVGSPADRNVELRVLTSSIEIGTEPGAAFSVSAPESGDGGRLLCAAGAVYWRDGSRAQSGWVFAGQFHDFNAGALSAPLSISGDGSAQLAALELLNAVRDLNALQEKLPSELTPLEVRAERNEILMK